MNCKRCDKPISEHQAGSEIDACVAVVVMGSSEPVYPHSHPHINPIYTDDGYWICYPEYKDGDVCEWEAIPFSTKIFRAWKIVTKLTDETQRFELITGHQDIAWIVGEKSGPKLGLYVCGVGDNMPHAICRVALKLMCE